MILWKKQFHEFRTCRDIDAKTIPSSAKFHIILMRDCVQCGPHYSASKGKSHYKRCFRWGSKGEGPTKWNNHVGLKGVNWSEGLETRVWDQEEAKWGVVLHACIILEGNINGPNQEKKLREKLMFWRIILKGRVQGRVWFKCSICPHNASNWSLRSQTADPHRKLP